MEYLNGRDLSYTVARHNGWYGTKELDGVARVVIPATNLQGARYWQARAMVKTLKANRWKSAQGSKNESIVVVWPNFTPNWKTKLVIVEGPMDALAAATGGHIGLAAMGKINVGDVVEYVKSGLRHTQVFDRHPVVIVPDVDSPEFGAKAITQLALAEIKAEIRMPEFEDLAALSRRKRTMLLS